MTDRLNAQSAGGNSPAVHTVDAFNWLVQGYRTTDPGLAVPAGEDTVSLPAVLAIDAAAAVDPNGMNLADLYRMLWVLGESSFRLEGRDYYAADHEDPALYQAWLASGSLPRQVGEQMAAWRELVGTHNRAGHAMRRVHLFDGSRPSPYLRYELAIQRANSVPVGEAIHVADLADCQELISDYPEMLSRDGDFWLFDNRIGVWMVYDDSGELVRLDRMTSSEVDTARAIRDRLWALSAPVEDVFDEPMVA